MKRICYVIKHFQKSNQIFLQHGTLFMTLRRINHSVYFVSIVGSDFLFLLHFNFQTQLILKIFRIKFQMKCFIYIKKKREKIYLGWLMMGCFGCLIGGCDERSSADFFTLNFNLYENLYKISKQHTLCFNKIEYKFEINFFFSIILCNLKYPMGIYKINFQKSTTQSEV